MMRQLNDVSIRAWILLLAYFNLSSCNNDRNDFPEDYVGFEHSKQTVKCDKDKTEGW